MTSIVFNMEDDLYFLIRKMTFIKLKVETNFFDNRRQPKLTIGLNDPKLFQMKGNLKKKWRRKSYDW
jgi:hypothetical protein